MNGSTAFPGAAIHTASNARATSTAAPSPTMRPIRSSGSGAAPHSSSRAFAASAISRRESTSVPSKSKTIRAKVKGQGLRAEFRERRGRLPDGDADDGEPLIGGLVEVQLRNSLDGGVAVEHEDRL